MLNVGGSRASYARCVLPILAPRSDYVGLAPLPEHHGCWPKGNDDLLSNEKIVHARARSDTIMHSRSSFLKVRHALLRGDS